MSIDDKSKWRKEAKIALAGLRRTTTSLACRCFSSPAPNKGSERHLAWLIEDNAASSPFNDAQQSSISRTQHSLTENLAKPSTLLIEAQLKTTWHFSSRNQTAVPYQTFSPG